jgi:predicted TIM-barrel fold metal-dependent hydrolase
MNEKSSRRAFLSAIALAAAALPRGSTRALAAEVPSPATPATDAIPILDTHIHLFDPTRPQGVPWPGKTDTAIYRPALPARYRDVTKPSGVVGALAVECSPWLEDNQWVLDIAARDTLIVGVVGNLEPGQPEFARQLERFQKNPLFRGIRSGNLWGRNLGAAVDKPQGVADFKLLAEAGLTLDTASPTPRLLADVVRLTDLVPRLRIVIDHLPASDRPTDTAAAATYETSLRELGQRPQVYVKVSEVLRRVQGAIAYDAAAYRPRLLEILGTFGPDRLLFGSDWPNSDPFGTYSQVLGVVRPFFLAQGRAVAEKFFWKNSVTAYRWKKREPGQP